MSSDHKEDIPTNKDPVQPPKAKQTTLDDFNNNNVVKKMSESKKNAVDNALMKLFVAKVLPMSLLDNSYFKEFVNLLNSKLVVFLSFNLLNINYEYDLTYFLVFEDTTMCCYENNKNLLPRNFCYISNKAIFL